MPLHHGRGARCVLTRRLFGFSVWHAMPHCLRLGRLKLTAVRSGPFRYSDSRSGTGIRLKKPTTIRLSVSGWTVRLRQIVIRRLMGLVLSSEVDPL